MYILCDLLYSFIYLFIYLFIHSFNTTTFFLLSISPPSPQDVVLDGLFGMDVSLVIKSFCGAEGSLNVEGLYGSRNLRKLRIYTPG
jgi:hypothetical protein